MEMILLVLEYYFHHVDFWVGYVEKESAQDFIFPVILNVI